MQELPDKFSRALGIFEAVFKLAGSIRGLIDGDDDPSFFPSKDKTKSKPNRAADGTAEASFKVNED